MHIIHIASELAPIAKVGGLADVLLGLPRELSWKKHEVDIVIPKYDCMDISQVRDLTIETPDFPSFYKGEWHQNTVWVGWVENLKVFFIDPHHPRHFFHRGCIYGCEDDIERFLYFSRAALEFVYKRVPKLDIIHLHDWQTSAIAPLYKDVYQPLGYTLPKIVLTIHNLEYQGKCAEADLDAVGLKGSSYMTLDKLQDQQYPNSVNLLKGGIVYSDYVTTVSPSYAQEIITKQGGLGLDSTLLAHRDKFSGILNGLDYSYWNPEIDRHLPDHYSSRETPSNKNDRNTLDKKAFLKKILREHLSLEEGYRPIVGCVTRLVPQKGVHLIKHALYRTLEKGGQFVLLGSSPIPSINDEFHQLRHHFQDHPHVSLTLVHQEEIAHLIYAGSDMFIVPSIFEPCGLTQLIALKYGAVPIVRRTGGLADTVFDVDDTKISCEKTNGFVFDNPDEKGMDSALDRAIQIWFENPERWRKIMINGMNDDYSWNLPAAAYVEIYKRKGIREDVRG